MILNDTNIYDVVMVIWGTLLLIALLIACMTYCHIQNKLKKDHLNKLNEHDRAVIFDYINSYSICSKHLKKSKKKKEKNNKPNDEWFEPNDYEEGDIGSSTVAEMQKQNGKY